MTKAPWYYWLVAVVGLLWNGLGTFLWAGTTFSPDSFLQGTPEVQRQYVASLPMWSSMTWGLGVLGGLIGSILLLFRKRTAITAFGASLAGAVINQLVYVTNPPPAGFFNAGLTAFIIGFAILLVWFSMAMKRSKVI